MVSFPKSVLALAFVSASLFAADYSKHSLTELQNLAGNVKPADALDYKIEIRKRIEQMTVKDARAFMQKVHQNTKAARDKMTRAEWDKYQAEVRKANQERIDSMTVKEARELGVFKNQYLGQESDRCGAPKKEQGKKQSREPL
ncbi:MAG: DUF1104 domain-containing protein [Helicobacter sp.]|nr:DUF1104 domain-containing protein [Helicobacter sp.]MDE6043992.1 DUF1104 domain-containing protein [Helicobacter sp.]MDE7196235.1 DUF1104 domain-containing protein [Helicobacter sp.]